MAFASKENIGIQGADLLARETMKHLDNLIGPVERPLRRSMSALRQTNRFGFDFLMKEYFADYQRKVGVLEQATGIRREEYATWFVKNMAVDNMSSRMKYLLNLDNQSANR